MVPDKNAAMLKDSGTDLLPWILGALLVGAGALTTVIATTVPLPTLAVPDAAPSNTSAVNTAPAVNNPAPAITVPAPLPVVIHQVPRPALAPGQVWRQLSEMNRIDPTPPAGS